MRRILVLLVALAATLPASATGEPECPSRIRVEGARESPLAAHPPPPTTAASASVCAATTLPVAGHVDERVLPPTIDRVLVRFLDDFGAGVPSLDAVVDGLGFANATLTLTRQVEPLAPRWHYATAGHVALPAGAVTNGTLDVTVVLSPQNATTTYRVVGP